jgi:hypothetical protein
MAGAALFLDVVMLEGGSNQARDAALLKERQDGRQDRPSASSTVRARRS